MEDFVLSDTLFGLLVTIAVVMVLWRPVPRARGCALAGLVLACAALDREQGVLLPIPFGLYLCAHLARRVPVRQVLAGMGPVWAALAIPPLAHPRGVYQVHGAVQPATRTGPFLHSRGRTFAECSVVHPP